MWNSKRYHRPSHIVLSPDQKQLAVVDRTGVRIVDADSGLERGEHLDLDAPDGMALSFLRQDRLVFLRLDGDEVKSWRPGSSPEAEFHLPFSGGSVALSGNGERVAEEQVERSDDGRSRAVVRVYEVRGGREVVRFVHDWSSAVLKLDSTGSRLLVAGDDDTEVVEVDTGLTRRLPALSAFGAAILSPDGRRVAMDDHDVQVWDALTGVELVEVPGPDVLLAFSPDGRRLVVANVLPNELIVVQVP